MGEKTHSVRGHQQNHTLGKGEQSIVEEGEVEEVLEFGTTTGDVQVVEPKSNHFTCDSAQRLIQEIMLCSHDLDLIKEKT
ncbi:hypothetical protein AB205_0126910 [Aquarana catesbeiana]|uniref:Uncharacterized protein n=1 Tax=Aquarana catesbeiana TaxID=8400 RepID=A0A2G9S7N2_AQUCT|nr:hypothetical protein AB205_0126910 [Aquarana catesbeiana]